VPRSRPQYPPEFKAEAIRLVKTSGDPLRQIARDLGVSDQTLRNWVKQDDVDAGRKSGLTSDERAPQRELEEEKPKAPRGARDPKKSRGLLRGRDRAEAGGVHRFIRAERANHAVATCAGFSRYRARGSMPSSGAGPAGASSKTSSGSRSARSSATRARPTAHHACTRCCAGAGSACRASASLA
jgi:transposase